MGVLSAIKSIEPTRLLQTILATEVEVYRGKYNYTLVQKGFQGGLLLSASIVGVGACGSEVISLIVDVLCKSAQKSIRGVQYIGKPAILDRLYKNVSDRPSLAIRVERILSQAIGILVSVLGTFFMLVIRNEWVTSQHQSLRNYVPAARALPPTPEVPAADPKGPSQKTLEPSKSQTSIPSTDGSPKATSGAPKAAPLVTRSPTSGPSNASVTQDVPPPSTKTYLEAAKGSTAEQSKEAPLPAKGSPIPPPPPPETQGNEPFVPIKKSDEPSQAIKAIKESKKSKQPQSKTVVSESANKSSQSLSVTKVNTSPVAAVTFAQELVNRTEAKKKNAITTPVVMPTKKQKEAMNTMGRALNRRSMAQRPQSEKVQFKNITEGFLVKASEVTLEEIEEPLGIEFEEKDKTKSLSDLIFDKNGDYPEEGTFFEFEGFKIQIVKRGIGNQGIEKVMVRFPTE